MLVVEGGGGCAREGAELSNAAGYSVTSWGKFYFLTTARRAVPTSQAFTFAAKRNEQSVSFAESTDGGMVRALRTLTVVRMHIVALILTHTTRGSARASAWGLVHVTCTPLRMDTTRTGGGGWCALHGAPPGK